MKTLSKHRLLYFTLASLGAYATYEGWKTGVWVGHQPGGGLFPLLAGIAFTTVALILALSPSQIFTDESNAGRPAWAKLFIYLGALGVIVLLLEPLGYIVTIGIAFVLILKLAENLNWARTFAVTATTLISAGFLFEKLLGVDLPHGTWW